MEWFNIILLSANQCVRLFFVYRHSVENTMFEHHLTPACKIFTTSTVATQDGMPIFAGLRVSKNSLVAAKAIKGCGLYFFLHHGHLIYIGKFLGTIHNAFGGDIFAARWNRHISTISLRGAKISISQGNLARATAQGLPADLLAILQVANHVKLSKDRGFVVPYKRLKYAAMHWAEFSSPPETWLRNIHLGYLQLAPDAWSNLSKSDLRKKVTQAEERAIQLIPTVLNGPGEFDAALIKKISIDQLFDRLEAIFKATEKKEVRHETKNQSKDINPEVESDFYSERFLELLPSEGPEETVAGIKAFFEDDATAQVHHTKTHGGDLRVRSLNAHRRLNIFTMYWQSRNQIFSCWIDLAPSNVVGEGVLDITPCSKRKQLTTNFKFDCSKPSAIDDLIALINICISRENRPPLKA